MPRPNAKIDTLEVKNFGPVDIRLDKKEGIFEASVMGKTLFDATRSGLEQKINDRVSSGLALTWQPVIEVYGLNPNAERDHQTDHERDLVENYLHLKINRFWVAKRLAGGWVRSNWEYADKVHWRTGIQGDYRSEHSHEEHQDFSGLGKPIVRRDGLGRQSTTVHLPYTEEVWAALLDVQIKMRQLEAALAKLVRSKAGYALLAAGNGPLMLTAPDVADDELDDVTQ